MDATKMPEITGEQILQSIGDELYFTAADALQAVTGIPATSQDVEETMRRHMFCVLTLRNGVVVTGEFAYPLNKEYAQETAAAAAKHNALVKIPQFLFFHNAQMQMIEHLND